MYSQREIKNLVKKQLKGNYWSLLSVIVSSAVLSHKLSWLVTGTLIFGVSMHSLNIAQYKERSFGDLFSGFNVFFKTLFLSLLIGLIFTVGLCLLIIPGILASLYLSQAIYILAEDNNKSVLQCISESYEMMKGNCGKLFCLNISYFWIVILSLALGITALVLGLIATSSDTFFIPFLLMCLFIISFKTVIISLPYIMPRYNLAMANFYLYVRGNQVYTENNNYNNYNNYNSYNQ